MAFDWVDGKRGVELTCGGTGRQNVLLIGTPQIVNAKLIEMLSGGHLKGQALIDAQYAQKRLSYRGAAGEKTQKPVRLGRVKR